MSFIKAPFTIPKTNHVVFCRQVPIDKLRHTAQNKFFENPESYRDCAKMSSLLDDIQDHSILTPLIAISNGQGKFDVMLGNRRLFAASYLKYQALDVVINARADDQYLPMDSQRLYTSDDVIAAFDGDIDPEHLCLDEKEGFVYCVASDHLQWATSGQSPEEWCQNTNTTAKSSCL